MEQEQMEEKTDETRNAEEEEEAERQRVLKRKQHIEEMKRQKHRVQILHRCILGAAAALAAAAAVGVCALIRFAVSREDGTPAPGQNARLEVCLEKVREAFRTAGAGVRKGAAAGEKRAALSGEGEETGSLDGALETGGEATGQPGDSGEEDTGNSPDGAPQDDIPEETGPVVFTASSTAETEGFWEEIVSQYGVLIDVASQTVLAEKECHTRISPASMTKILTVLTAADALGIRDGTEEVLNDLFTMTIDITDYSYVNDCSIAGFQVDEMIPVRDLFYGTVLPSGADAAVGLAVYTAGSQEAFVELMNEKLQEMGLAETTHFTNCVGLYDEAHYSTVYDIAVILKEAADNPFCRQVLSAHTYNTAQTTQHPEGILLSNWFLRRIEDRDTHGEVLCGKTGFVNQSGSCAASLSVDGNGREYLCVTAGSSSSWQCIDDQNMLYEKYLPAL